MAGKLSVNIILVTAMATLVLPLNLHAKTDTPILIASADTPYLLASADTPYLLASSDPQYLIAGSDPRYLVAGSDPRYLVAGSDPRYLVAGSNPQYLVAGYDSSYLVANSSPDLYAAGYYAVSPVISDAYASGFMTYATPLLLGQSRGYFPFLYNGIYQPIIPIQRDTVQTSWFSYGYTGFYQNPKNRSIIHMNPILTGMRLRYEYRDQTRSTDNFESKESGYKLSEQVNFSTKGWFYDRNFIQYTLYFAPEFIQIVEENDGEDLSDNYFSPDFRLTLTAFENKPGTLNFHASHENNANWSLYSVSEERIDSIGAEADYDIQQMKYLGRVYSSLGYNYVNSETEGFYDSTSKTHSVNFTSSQKSSRSQGKFRIKYTDIDRTRTINNIRGRGDQYTTLDTLLTHLLYLSERKQSNLQTTGSYYTQEFANNTFEYFNIGTAANLVHSPGFRSRYKIGYKRNQNDNSDGSNTYDSEVSLTHRLYENLVTDAGILSSYQDSGNNDSTEVNPFLKFDYTRDIPWGNFSLLAGWDYRITYRDGYSENSLFKSDRFAAVYGVDITLSQENIDVNTIVVSGTNPPQLFIKDVDYELETIGNRTVLRVLPLGSINNGQEIAINYNYARDYSYDSSLFSHHYGFQLQLFEQLEFRYIYSQSTEDALSGTVPGRLTDNSRHQAKAIHNYRWLRSEATYEINDYQDETTKSLFLNETLHLPVFSRGDLSLSGSWGNTEYDTMSGDSEYYGASANFKWNVAQWCNFTVSAHYQENDSPLSDTINSGVRTTLNFYYRIWQASLYWQYLNQEHKSNRSDSQRESNLIRFDIIRLRW